MFFSSLKVAQMYNFIVLSRLYRWQIACMKIFWIKSLWDLNWIVCLNGISGHNNNQNMCVLKHFLMQIKNKCGLGGWGMNHFNTQLVYTTKWGRRKTFALSEKGWLWQMVKNKSNKIRHFELEVKGQDAIRNVVLR